MKMILETSAINLQASLLIVVILKRLSKRLELDVVWSAELTLWFPNRSLNLIKFLWLFPFMRKFPRKSLVFNNARVLSQDPDIGFLFRDKFISSYKNHQNIKRQTVRSKLSSSIEEIPGNFPCGSNKCLTCQVLCGEPVITGPCGSFEIKRSFTCVSSCVIYVVTCLKCDVLYVGETSMTLRNRKNGHFSDIRCKRVKKSEVAEHF